MLETRKVQQHFQVIKDRIHLPMHLIEARAGLRIVRDLRAARRIHAGIEIDAAKTHHAKRRAGDVDQSHRSPSSRSTVQSRGGLSQKHTGEDGFAVSSWLCVMSDIEPMLIGNAQLQQISVIGFANLP